MPPKAHNEVASMVSHKSCRSATCLSRCSLWRIFAMTSAPRTEPIRQGVHFPQDSMAQNSAAYCAMCAMLTVSKGHDAAVTDHGRNGHMGLLSSRDSGNHAPSGLPLARHAMDGRWRCRPQVVQQFTRTPEPFRPARLGECCRQRSQSGAAPCQSCGRNRRLYPE